MFSSGQLMDTLNTAEIYLDSCLFPFFSVSFPSDNLSEVFPSILMRQFLTSRA